MGLTKTKLSRLPNEMREARFKRDLEKAFLQSRITGRRSKMGYRSTVAYTIRFTPDPENSPHKTIDGIKQAKASFSVFLAEAKVKCSGAFNEEFGVEVDEPNMAINFLAEDVKWYEDYEGVKAHEALIDLSKEWAEESDVPFKGGNKNIGGIFMRIGEEADDVTEESWGEHDWEWMQISRQIIVDWM